jgi:hypothetical protein
MEEMMVEHNRLVHAIHDLEFECTYLKRMKDIHLIPDINGKLRDMRVECSHSKHEMPHANHHRSGHAESSMRDTRTAIAPTYTGTNMSESESNKYSSTSNGFHTKTSSEQRKIVGDAVRSVMDDYDITPRTQSKAVGQTSSNRSYENHRNSSY